MFTLFIDRQSRVIIAAYIIFCIGLLITSLLVARQTRLTMTAAEALYLHPFTASSAALEAKVAAMTMRRNLLFALLSKEAQKVEQAKAHIAKLDTDFSASMATVRSAHQGDSKELDRIETLFRTWQPTRDKILDMAQSGDSQQAQQLMFTQGTPMFEAVNAELDEIVEFSRNQAGQYMREAQDLRDNSETLILLTVLGGFAASLLCSVVVIRRVRQVVKSHELAMEHMAHFDLLTGLPNRQLFFDRLCQALRLAEREKSSLALLFVDLDKFKAINDTHGHEAGDAILRHVATQMTAAVRRSDTVARLGGDEFVILVLDLRDQTALRDLANKVIRAASTPVDFQGRQLCVGASVGIAMYPQDSQEAKELLSKADEAMYEAKKAGRNQCRFFFSDPHA